VLLVAGRQDRIVPLALVRRLAEALPTAQLESARSLRSRSPRGTAGTDFKHPSRVFGNSGPAEWVSDVVERGTRKRCPTWTVGLMRAVEIEGRLDGAAREAWRKRSKYMTTGVGLILLVRLAARNRPDQSYSLPMQNPFNDLLSASDGQPLAGVAGQRRGSAFGTHEAYRRAERGSAY
jgi:hypothetical protein